MELKLYAQNTRGLKKEEKLEELVEQGIARGAFAIAMQETWRTGNKWRQFAKTRGMRVAYSGGSGTSNGTGAPQACSLM